MPLSMLEACKAPEYLSHVEVRAKSQSTAKVREIKDRLKRLFESRSAGIWENLLFDGDIKKKLLNYAMTMLSYSDRKVDPNIIRCNRVVLLHGPPGTGKTSLCKALAQKLVIRTFHRFKSGLLVEINSSGLYSKWFSVRDTLVRILIDEVESLAAARKYMMNGNEPSDSMRVVNALLAQLDSVQRNPNVLILTTSTVTGALDLAFIDRADRKEHIGPPSTKSVYSIYNDCITEKINKGIINEKLSLLPLDREPGTKRRPETIHEQSERLWSLSGASEGLTGRSVRKVISLAHTTYIEAPQADMQKYINDHKKNEK